MQRHAVLDLRSPDTLGSGEITKPGILEEDSVQPSSVLEIKHTNPTRS